jgi:hypothetical protein
MTWMTKDEEIKYLRTMRKADIIAIDILREQLETLRAENAELRERLDILWPFASDKDKARAEFLGYKYALSKPTESAVDTEPGERARDTVVGPPVSPETANKFIDETKAPNVKAESKFVIPVVDRGKED